MDTQLASEQVVRVDEKEIHTFAVESIVSNIYHRTLCRLAVMVSELILGLRD